MSDDEELVEVDDVGEAPAPSPAGLATLGEILEAHHRRFVERIRRRRQSGEEQGE